LLENKSTDDTALQTDNETSMLSELDISLSLSPGTMSIVDILLTKDVQPPDVAVNIDQMQSQSEIWLSAQSAVAMQPAEPTNVVTVEDLGPGATASLSQDAQPPDLATNIDQMQSQSEIRSSAQFAIAMQALKPINVVTVKDLEPGATASLPQDAQPPDLATNIDQMQSQIRSSA